jgi:hypothetical protein
MTITTTVACAACGHDDTDHNIEPTCWCDCDFPCGGDDTVDCESCDHELDLHTTGCRVNGCGCEGHENRRVATVAEPDDRNPGLPLDF